MDNTGFFSIKNHGMASLNDIPVVALSTFRESAATLLSDTDNHCALYFTVPLSDVMKFICCIARDKSKDIVLLSHEMPLNQKKIESLTPLIPALHIFEREISENYDISFEGHPWLKPVRFPGQAPVIMDNYPFLSYNSNELHEVGVGPVHAGVIEPGHFRFICNGEKVIHLEIQLGYQHRGVENLMLKLQSPLQRTLLAENIAGDSTVAHTWAHTALMESLSEIKVSDTLLTERTIALELERIAVHIGDTAALCTDVAYQLGQVANEALRTAIINTTQMWCGNRFGKGLIRTGGSHYHISTVCKQTMSDTLRDTSQRYSEITDRIFSLPSVLTRFDGIGSLSLKQVSDIGAVGMSARMAGLRRDIRTSHPFGIYLKNPYSAITETSGDVLARALLRQKEVLESSSLINKWLADFVPAESGTDQPTHASKLKPGCFSISLIEGWRGEICHAALTDNNGRLMHYKIKDPSLHNWFCLALAVRNQEISDFPVCNKSFNLSYCGNDL